MDKVKTISNVKELRRNLDAILQRVDSLEFINKNFVPKEIVHLKIVEAIMWLGICLKELGELDPYPESRNPNSQRIEPISDGLKL